MRMQIRVPLRQQAIVHSTFIVPAMLLCIRIGIPNTQIILLSRQDLSNTVKHKPPLSIVCQDHRIPKADCAELCMPKLYYWSSECTFWDLCHDIEWDEQLFWIAFSIYQSSIRYPAWTIWNSWTQMRQRPTLRTLSSWQLNKVLCSSLDCLNPQIICFQWWYPPSQIRWAPAGSF